MTLQDKIDQTLDKLCMGDIMLPQARDYILAEVDKLVEEVIGEQEDPKYAPREYLDSVRRNEHIAEQLRRYQELRGK